LPVNWVLSDQALGRARIIAGIDFASPPLKGAMPSALTSQCTPDPCGVRANLAAVISAITAPDKAKTPTSSLQKRCCL